MFLVSHPAVIEQLKHLEDEQEELNSSLLALTSHFAQVQFRLKQIISAEPEDKEVMYTDIKTSWELFELIYDFLQNNTELINGNFG